MSDLKDNYLESIVFPYIDSDMRTLPYMGLKT